jgi:hypothetical protein
LALFSKTEDEKIAEAAAKQQKEAGRVAEAQRKAAEAQRKSEEKAAQEFARSPQGRARAAVERGDELFQYSLDLQNTQAMVSMAMGAQTKIRSSTDPNEVLNSICREGWELVNGSVAFVETGSETRDKFLASGQNVATRGTLIGHYLFRRKVS